MVIQMEKKCDTNRQKCHYYNVCVCQLNSDCLEDFYCGKSGFGYGTCISKEEALNGVIILYLIIVVFIGIVFLIFIGLSIQYFIIKSTWMDKFICRISNKFKNINENELSKLVDEHI